MNIINDYIQSMNIVNNYRYMYVCVGHEKCLEVLMEVWPICNGRFNLHYIQFHVYRKTVMYCQAISSLLSIAPCKYTSFSI